MVLFSEESLKDIKYSHLKEYDYEDYLEFLIFYDYYHSKYNIPYLKKNNPKNGGNLSRIYSAFSNTLSQHISFYSQNHEDLS